ncbi:MAG: family 43 glycosylhydrolase, partial [Clostridia bacterium]|nr:family 43 glycosylhydrolase [Clostridia bacterium]
TVAKAATLAGLGRAEPVAVWTATGNSVVDDSIWSPELHYFSAEEFGEEYAGWYLYFACPDADHPDDNFYRRSYALRALTDDPQGAWGSPVDKKANIPTQIIIDTDNSSWNIGPSIFRIDGKIYMTWTGRIFEYYGTHTQSLNIALMTNPYTIDLSTKAVLCEPTESWEKQGATYSSSIEKNMPEVVEGATAVYGDNGEVWCIYSASGYWTDYYALAQLRYLGGDPCNINNWEKCSSPIFKQNSEVYGPGHASYTKGHDGKNYFIYHGYLEPASVDGRARSIFIEEFTISGNNVVLGSGKPKALSTVYSVENTPLSIKDRTVGFFRDVYVSSQGNDSRDGSTADKAVKTLDRAFALLSDGGRIILTGTSYDIGENYSTPVSDAEYILTSRLTDSNRNAGIVTYKGTLSLNSDFVIECIRFKGSGTPIIVCNGHNVTFGKNIKNDSNSYIVGGANLTASDNAEKGSFTEDYTITIESGVWVSLFGGNRRVVGEAPCSTISGDINVVIDGAVFKNSSTNTQTNLNSISGMNSTTGNINLTVKSGEFYTSIFLIGRIGTDGSNVVHTGNVSVKLTGGKFNVTGNGAGAGVIDVCQDAYSALDGNYTIE